MQAVLFLSIVILVYFLLRFLINHAIETRRKKGLDQQTEDESATQSMVRCAHCGVHLPQSEAYFDGQHTYCSEGHMRLGPRKLDQSGDSETDGD